MINTLITNLRLMQEAKKILKESYRHNVSVSIKAFPIPSVGYVKYRCYGAVKIPVEIGLSFHLLFQKWFSLVLFHEVGHILHPQGGDADECVSELAAWEWCFSHGTHPIATYEDVAARALKAFLTYGEGVKQHDQMMLDFVTMFLARNENKVQ